MLFEYSAVLIFLIVALALSCVLLGASYLLSNKNPDYEKVQQYECGFNPFSDSRQPFEVRFFLVGILFIIFDLEISFLFPWSLVLSDIHVFGYWTMVTFLGILTIGLVYEWLKGGLEWE
ncbi:NADH dehydrogenase subunit 9 (mitochondrion) [Monosiga brevicollis]|uniref:NADH-ubiquinone oxidoreductase chain 3 n=1 Tax=Monosiga brevicollis TaxID=81824 RepID=Q8HIS5_MONBE|nr:NADH dehydrogenase subunit 9 [Monosiga brevicollis]AAN28359.1 NADH dehydrogenase subunit 9 [Monosiga brevicollis]|eukprot:NP_696988.1 NADH dehydrogenase subunit 9 (mitochondrion) [Monosiga brevicollis ATCC 50154]